MCREPGGRRQRQTRRPLLPPLPRAPHCAAPWALPKAPVFALLLFHKRCCGTYNSLKKHFIFYYFFFFGYTVTVWDLGSLTKGGNLAPGSEDVES